MKGFLGIDCGSSSIKIAIIDKDNNLLDAVYLKNEGIIDTIKKAFHKINKNYDILSAGCTGSGRDFVKILIGADIVKTEILAHGTAALAYYPDVNTIIDIGAEDSKLINITNKYINNFAMNSICSAGCGAMLESIATRMGIKIEDVGDIALQSKNKINIPAKCGVFAQSAVVTMLNKGIDKRDILMGVCRGLINNYLTLAKSIELKPPYVYQGMTAKNKALVKALEEQLNHKIIVDKNCEFMGAIGIAILTKENKPDKTNFRGFEIKDLDIKSKTFICEDCANQCEITEIFQVNEKIGAIGSRCEKW